MDLRRYERKFVVGAVGAAGVRTHIRLHSALFSEIYHERVVHSLYFDTPDFRFFHDNREGLSVRTKIRLRWYGEDEDLHLEEKYRDGPLVGKARHEVPPLPLEDARTVVTTLEAAGLPDRIRLALRGLHPALFVRYRRRYFLSADHRFRATVDEDVSYRAFEGSSPWQRPFGLESTILELKYGLDDDAAAARLTGVWPFRLSRNSKYVTGIERVYV